MAQLRRVLRLGTKSISDARCMATYASMQPGAVQNITEQIVQRFAVDLPRGKVVQSGDYLSIKPEHCMTHDNCK